MTTSAATVESITSLHNVDLRKVLHDKILHQMIKHVTQLTHGWVIMVVDDETTRTLTQVTRMSELMYCGVFLLERLKLERQPFPKMNVVYFIAPTAVNIRRLVRDFEDPNEPKYHDVYLYFLYHASEEAFSELQNAPQIFIQRLRIVQEVNVDFLALEKCAFTFGMSQAFHTLYSPSVQKSESEKMIQEISNKLVSVCATLQEYPYVRYQAGNDRMEMLAHLFQNNMNHYMARDLKFSCNPQRGTLLLIDRGQDMVTPLMHESTFQAMIYDLLDVADDQVSYEVETNAGTTTRTAFLSEDDKQWVEFRHTHIAKVSMELLQRMIALSKSSAGTSLGRNNKSIDLHMMAAGLREFPEYREVLNKLNQHLSLAGQAMDIFTSKALLDASNIKQTLATGVKASGKKLKQSTIVKRLEELLKNPYLTEADSFRVVAIFLLTQDTMKEADRNKLIRSALLSKKHETVFNNMQLVAGPALYKRNGNSLLSNDELKMAAKRAMNVEYSNARYDPKIKAIVTNALRRTLSEIEYPYLISPPALDPNADGSTNKPEEMKGRGQFVLHRQGGIQRFQVKK